MTFSIRFDYRFDATGFFDDPQRRAALDEAARIWGRLIEDDFDAVPAGIPFSVTDPSNRSVDRDVTLSQPIDDLLIFVGADNIGNALAVAGADGFDAKGDIFNIRSDANFRDQGPVTDFEPWTGTITFDPDAAWSFDLNTTPSNRYDFVSVALHEIAHILGVGASPAFDALVTDAGFAGPNARAENGGRVIPLDARDGHVADDFQGGTILLDPTLAQGARKRPTDLDLALLADIGYQIDGFDTQGRTPAIATQGDDQSIFGTVLNDTLSGRGGDDAIRGNAGNDRLSGDAGNDLLFGDAGNDLLIGGTGDDELQGGAGRDTLVAGAGQDTLFGQDGVDTYRILAEGGSARIVGMDLAREMVELDGSGFTSVAQAVASISKPFGNVSRLIFEDGTRVDISHVSQNGTPLLARNFVLTEGGAQTQRGTDRADQMDGNLGAQALLGLGGDDTLLGYGGDDTLNGGTGADLMNGGPGSDVIVVDNAGDRVVESRRWDGEDLVIASVDFRMGRSHIEDLRLVGDARLGAGNGLANQIRGNNADNVLDGGGNVDTLMGGNGDDRYLIRSPGDVAIETADAGIDTVLAFRSHRLGAHVEKLFLQGVRTKAGDPVQDMAANGNGLDNTLVGNPFDNVLAGRGGRDTMKGQGGADRFVFDTALGPGNVDRVVDFSAAEGDTIAIRASLVGLERGDLAAARFHQGRVAEDAADRLIFDANLDRLYYDADGSGAGRQVLIATFDGNPTLGAGDIEIF